MGEISITVAEAPNTCQQRVSTRRGDYLVQVSWPLTWSENGEQERDRERNADVDVLYLVDGNAYFFTATDIVRRFQMITGKQLIVAALGYPLGDTIFCRPRRSADFTPPTKDGNYRQPQGRDGKPLEDVCFGGAEDFLDIIATTIIPLVEGLFPKSTLRHARRALFGHSYGGLFALTAMFTQPDLFETVIAASPSIWWNDRSITREQERQFVDGGAKSKPRLVLTYGSEEQYPRRMEGESDEGYKSRREDALDKRMRDNALDLHDRLESSNRLGSLSVDEFIGEDHGSAAVCGLQRGLARFLHVFQCQ